MYKWSKMIPENFGKLVPPPSNMDPTGGNDSPWLDDEYQSASDASRALDAIVAAQEWSKLSSKFTDAGYRDGITEGKNSKLQQGFDQGFGLAAPYARRVGILRGVATSLLSLMTALSASTSGARSFGSTASSSAGSSKPGPAWVQATFNDETGRDKTRIVAQLRNIVERLSKLDESKVVPPDLEAIEHAQTHDEGHPTSKVDSDADQFLSLRMHDKKEMNELESLMGNLDGGHNRPTVPAPPVQADSVEACQHDLAHVLAACGLDAGSILPLQP
ncbi:hypothetical protein OIV83_000200 [Microbotryomycetes sp. JL201]|nr:hypothetical protein OIV83_000200 [Microbotryomycetes sp. JL201]